MKEVRVIKGYNTQINKLSSEIKILKSEISERAREVNLKNNTIKELKNNIKKLQNKGGIKVSEHAILRYLERVIGMDLNAIEGEILNPDCLDLISKMGSFNGTYPSRDFKIHIVNNTVTTVTNK